jgi:hypothetical protein
MSDATTIGKWIILAGAGLAVLGGLVWLAGRTGLPLGRLPGDINIQNGNITFYLPCASSIIISIVLTILLNVAVRLFRR